MELSQEPRRSFFISQPSLSESLNKVEQEFGTRIFSRTQEGLVPTAFGAHYLKTARNILDRYRKLETDLDEYRQLRKGSLTFGIPFNLGAYLLPRILPAFQQIYPDITVQFKENNSTELDKLMLSGKLDFSVMHYETPNEAIHYDLLAEDDFYLVMPLTLARKYQFPDYRTLSIYDLKALEQEPFLMVASRQKLRQVADSILSQLSIKPNIRYTTKNMETAKRLAAAGMGITFLPHSYLNLFSGVENLACYPLDDKQYSSPKPRQLHRKLKLHIYKSKIYCRKQNDHPPACRCKVTYQRGRHCCNSKMYVVLFCYLKFDAHFCLLILPLNASS